MAETNAGARLMLAAHNAAQKGVDQSILLAITQMLDAVSGAGSGLRAAQPKPETDGAARTTSKRGGGDTGGGSKDGGGKKESRKRAPTKWRDARHEAGVYASRQLARKGADKAKVEAGVKKIYKGWKTTLSDGDMKDIMARKPVKDGGKK